MNKKVLLVVSVIIAVLIGGVAFTSLSGNKGDAYEGEKISFTHRYGVTEVPKNPEKVVVLDYGALDIMQVFGVEPIALPKSNLPTFLSKYNDEKYVDIGTLKEFSLEKINELKPDLIIIEGRQESFYEELSKIAPTIGLGTVDNNHFESVENNVKILGEIFGKEKVAENKLDELKNDIEEVSKSVKEKDLNAQVVLVSDGSMSAMGKETRYKMIFNEFGFKQSDEALGDAKHGQNISNEYLIEKNPNYIFVIDRGQVLGNQKPAKDIVENEIVKKTDAYKNGNLEYLSPETWYIGGAGISSTEVMIKEIKEALK
ncbi:MAG: siderophore ABC transporter substrate-binding protein [Clostridium sp.]